MLIIFGILYYLIWRIRRPSFRGVLSQSGKGRDRRGHGPSERPRKPRPRQALADYQHQLADARGEARRSGRTPARRRSESRRGTARLSAQEESARIVARGDEQLQTQRGQVVRELRQEIGSLAVELSEKIVR